MFVSGWIGVWSGFGVFVKGCGRGWVRGDFEYICGGNVCGIVVMLLLIEDVGVRWFVVLREGWDLCVGCVCFEGCESDGDKLVNGYGVEYNVVGLLDKKFLMLLIILILSWVVVVFVLFVGIVFSCNFLFYCFVLDCD